MKRLLLTLVLVIGLCSPASGQMLVDCHGTESAGSGLVDCDANPRAYAYKVSVDAGYDPGCEYLCIGTNDGNEANYTNICMPDNWIFFVRADDYFPHYTEKTPHGGISGGPDGNCPFYICFDGQGTGNPVPAGGSFNFGFDHPQSSHDVGWEAGPNREDWGTGVGTGPGPVHGPKSPYEGPTLSQWGLITLLIILAAVATWVVLKRRRVVTA